MMFRSFFIMTAIGVVFCHMAYAQSPPPSSPKAVEAEQKHDATARQAREAYRRAIIAADQQYVSGLDAALKNAMQTLDIDLARTLDDQKKSAIAVLERDQSELDVAGEWTVTAAPSSSGHVIINSVTPIAAVNSQYIIITGSGFGDTPPQIRPIGDGSVELVGLFDRDTVTGHLAQRLGGGSCDVHEF